MSSLLAGATAHAQTSGAEAPHPPAPTQEPENKAAAEAPPSPAPTQEPENKAAAEAPHPPAPTQEPENKAAAEVPFSPAPTQEAENKAAAEELFRKGKALYSQERVQEAYEAYKKAWGLRKTYEIAGNLGNVALELGKPREAAEYLAYSRAMFPANGSLERRARLEATLAEARRQVATVRVEVRRSDKADHRGRAGGAGAPSDGHLVEQAPHAQELFLDPGHYTLKARLPGYTDGERVIHAKKGSVETVLLMLEPTKAPEGSRAARTERAAPKEVDAPAPSWRSLVVGAGLGVAAVGLGVGIGSAVHSRARRADRDEAFVKLFGAGGDGACSAGGGGDQATCKELVVAETGRQTFQAISIASFIVGGAGAATSIAFSLFVGRSSPPGSKGRSAVSFSFGLAPGAGAASVRGSF